MAHAIFAAEVQRRGLEIGVSSAGVWDFEGDLPSEQSTLTCQRHGTPMPEHLSTPLDKVDLSDATRVFVMEKKHLDEVLARTGLPPERVGLLGELDPEQGGPEIADPIGDAAFEVCYTRLRACILHYLETTEDFR